MVSVQRSRRSVFPQVFANCIMSVISLEFREIRKGRIITDKYFVDSYFSNSVKSAMLAIVFRHVILEFQEKIICILKIL